MSGRLNRWDLLVGGGGGGREGGEGGESQYLGSLVVG